MGLKRLEAGERNPPKPKPGVNGSIAVKSKAWMRWVQTVSVLMR